MKLSTPAAVLVGSIILAGALTVAAGRLPGRYQIVHSSGPMYARLDTATGEADICFMYRESDEDGTWYGMRCDGYRSAP